MSYIYKIVNSINNKMYIGKTSFPIEKRFQEHISASKKERCEKRPLYYAMNKYGIENFFIEEIEEVENDDIACQREQYWIKKLRTYIGYEDCVGYNATLGGDSRRLYDYEEISKKYIELQSVKETCKFFNCDKLVVNLACEENNVTILDGRQRRQVRRYNIDKTEYKDYPSITEAAKDIPNKPIETARKNISRAINKGLSAYGYYWKRI